MKAHFYLCPHCGNLVYAVQDSGVPMVCCGQKMQRLEANTVEASGEKHLPVVAVSGDAVTVTVGAVEHPMADVHYIQWIFLETDRGGQLHTLQPGEAPQARFVLGGAKPAAAYAYCNLHGLWAAEV